MRYSACARCNAVFPLGQMLSFRERTLCPACAPLEAQETTPQAQTGELVRLVDPTVCAFCQGEVAWPTMMGSVPTCTPCLTRMRNRPYPLWLKTAFAGVLAITVLAFVQNQRFFSAYREMKHGMRAAEQGDLHHAAAWMYSASLRVPEYHDWDVLVSLYRGADLLAQDKPTEAVPFLRQSDSLRPGGAAVSLLAFAEWGAAFDAKDYDAFLAKALEMIKREGENARTLCGVASGYACKYAVTGDEEYKRQATEYLDKAREQSGGDADDFKEYEARIVHRLKTREIISRAEYDRRFRQGRRAEEKSS